MIIITIPIAIIVGVIIARYYAPKTKSEKVWTSILIPLIGGILINLLVAACKNSGYGFAFDLGSTLVFVAIPAVALMITLFISLKVGGKKDWNDTSTMKLHYGTGEDRVDFEVCLTQKEILQMAKLREQDPKKWKDNELELVKAVRNGINVGKPNENDNKDQNPELLTDNPIETDTTAEDPTAPKGLITNKKLADEIRTEKRTERNLNQEKDSEKPHIFKMKRSVRIILAIVACIVLFILFSALTTILGLKHGGGAIVMIVFMGLMAFVWRSIVGKKTDEGPQNDNNDNLIIEENTVEEGLVSNHRTDNEPLVADQIVESSKVAEAQTKQIIEEIKENPNLFGDKLESEYRRESVTNAHWIRQNGTEMCINIDDNTYQRMVELQNENPKKWVDNEFNLYLQATSGRQKGKKRKRTWKMKQWMWIVAVFIGLCTIYGVVARVVDNTVATCNEEMMQGVYEALKYQEYVNCSYPTFRYRMIANSLYRKKMYNLYPKYVYKWKGQWNEKPCKYEDYVFNLHINKWLENPFVWLW